MQSICDQTVVMQKLRNTFVSDKVALSRQGLLAFVTKELLFVFVFVVVAAAAVVVVVVVVGDRPQWA